MTISAQIIADSTAEHKIRITTFLLRYPRFIHAEFMTHRQFSRNASSSRAIPVRRQIKNIRQDPAIPIHWGANQKGMQADQELSPRKKRWAKRIWLGTMWVATEAALWCDWLGLHKQVANRLCEPWAHITVLVTSTAWSNFYALRDHKDAQPEMQALARAMIDAQKGSLERYLSKGEWHLPFVDDKELVQLGIDICIKMSVARCARTSYDNYDGTRPDSKTDVKLYERLVVSEPLHASPAEHQATPDEQTEMMSSYDLGPFLLWRKASLHGNFNGWIQHRKTLPSECR